jgi:hypothetical protein
MLERVELPRNQLLCAAGCSPEHVYFPTTAIVSLVSITSDGASVAVAVVGNDGVAGISFLLGVDSAATDALGQSAGRAFRISVRFVKAEIEHFRGVINVVLRYAQNVLGQMAQRAIFNLQPATCNLQP